MLRNYFKTAWRNLFRNKAFSLTNLLGLSIGMTCSMLILMWVQDELNYNKSQENYDHIYQTMANRHFNGQVFTDPSMVLPLAKAVEAEVPQVKNAVVTSYPVTSNFANGDRKLKKTGFQVSDHFFDLFSVDFVEGNAATALQDPSSVVLTASTAKALFGKEDPLNQMVKINNRQDAKVSAIVADLPPNTTLSFDYLTPFNYSDEFLKPYMTDWVNSSWQVYVQTVPGADIAAVEKKINQVKYEHDQSDKSISTYFLFPMSKWRLYSEFKDGVNTGGMIEYVRLFSIIAIIILVIACINFMNLSTARSERRAKEVGIRKTLGSSQKQLVLQFYFESVILAFLAFMLSLAAVYLLLPSFNLLVQKELSIDFTNPVFWLAAFAIILFTGIVAGSYPAVYLSSFKPIKVLKGAMLTGKSAIMPRHILVVAQFVISILLISATIVVYLQIQHVKNRDIGYNPDNLIMLPASDDINKNYDALKNDLLASGAVSSITRTSAPITAIWNYTPAPDYSGKPADANMIMAAVRTGKDFTRTMGIKMLEGHDFTGTPADSSSMLLNKAAVELMGLKDPVGTQVRYGRIPRNYTITGVTENVVMASPFKPVDPMIVLSDDGSGNYVTVRLNKNIKLQTGIHVLSDIFQKYDPSSPFDYQFVDQEFGKKFASEELISTLTRIFAGLAIFISCLGLAGLASFTIEIRNREIGIRKVLGASVQQILFLISKDFLKLVLIALVLALPLTWWFLNNWLQQYEYRIDLSIWMFIGVGIFLLLLTLLIVSLNSMTAALRKPVKTLRTE